MPADVVCLILLIIGLEEAELVLVRDGESDKRSKQRVLEAALELPIALILAKRDAEFNQILVRFLVVLLKLVVGREFVWTLVDGAFVQVKACSRRRILSRGSLAGLVVRSVICLSI